MASQVKFDYALAGNVISEDEVKSMQKIAEDARKCGFYDYVLADTFEEAVLLAARTAERGDAVLL